MIYGNYVGIKRSANERKECEIAFNKSNEINDKETASALLLHKQIIV